MLKKLKEYSDKELFQLYLKKLKRDKDEISKLDQIFSIISETDFYSESFLIIKSEKNLLLKHYSYNDEFIEHNNKSHLAKLTKYDDVFTIEENSELEHLDENLFKGVKLLYGIPLTTRFGHHFGTICFISKKKIQVPPEINNRLIVNSEKLTVHIDFYLNDLKYVKLSSRFNKIQQQFEDVQHISKAGHWELEVISGITTWSKEIYHIHEVEENTPMNKIDAINFYASHERPRLNKLLQNAIETKSKFQGEFEFTDALGIKKWVKTAGYPILDDQGDVLKLIGTFQDISDIKKATIREQTIIKQSFDAILTLSPPDWKITSANPRALDLFKITDDLNVLNFTPDDLSPDFQKDGVSSHSKAKYYSNEAMTKGNVIFDWTHLDFVGNEIECSVSLSKVTIGDDSFLQATIRDLTSEKEQERENQYILQTMRVGTWTWDILKNDLFWNDSNYQVFNLSKENCNGAYEAWEQVLHPDHKESIVKGLNGALKSSRDYNATFPILCMDNEVRYIGAKAEITRNESGQAIKMIGINWDKTQEYKMAQELESQKKLSYHNAKLISLGQLAAGVGHEINNPLAIISGHCTLINKAIKNDEITRIPLSIDKIQYAIERISNIVKGLKTFSRSDNEDFKTFNLTQLIENTVQMLIEIYDKEGILISNNCIEQVFVFGNRGRIQQVLVNLFSNARDAVLNSNDKTISISIAQIEKHSTKKCLITVADSGEGIPEENMNLIFDPFFTSKEINKGTGIGLSLCHRIINEHEGDLNVTSQINQGSVFSFDLNLSSEENLDEEETSKVIQEKKKVVNHYGHILIVDDEVDIRDILDSFISDLGFSCDQASNGQEALDLYLSEPKKYKCIISDMQMPKLDGSTLFKKIRNTHNEVHPKLIMLTGGININFEDKASELGKLIDGFLSKPFTSDSIKETIFSLLKINQ